MRRRVFSLLSFLLIFAILLPNFPAQFAFATTDSIWAGTISATDLGIVSSDENKGNTLCEQGLMSYSRFPKGKLVFNEYKLKTFDSEASYKVEDSNVCLLQNNNGLFGVGSPSLWSPDGNPANGLILIPGTVTYEPAPGGKAFLVRTNSPNGYYLSLNDSMEGIGRLDADIKVNYSDLAWRILNYADGLRFENDELVQFWSHALSSNGRYLTAHLSNGMLVRIDLQTQELKAVGYSAQVLRDMSVSNDGNYLVAYRTGNLLFYDLNGCTSSYSKGSWPQAGMSIDGCTQQNLYSRVSALQPQVGNGSIKKLRFAPNNASFTVDGGWRGVSGEYGWRRFEFRPENYTSKAEGYLAMGDSFSSGEGDTEGGVWYEKGTDEQGDKDTFRRT
jgi:hypothetical protein